MSKLKSTNNDGRITTVISGENSEVIARRDAYLKRYPYDRFGTCQVSYFEKPNGTLEVELIRNSYPYL